jgi:pilus assembly protein CpaB
LQNIEVLSAGQNIAKNTDGKPESVGVVNLLVTPAQAEILSLASHQTHIQLILRNPLDTQETKTPGTATANLFSGMPFRAPTVQSAVSRSATPRVVKVVQQIEKPAEKIVVPIVVEIFHGGKKAQTQFQGTPEEKN